MEESSENKFIICDINWNIENFCFVHSPDNSLVLGPEFMLQGLKTVKWKMSLELQCDESSENDLVSIYLEKLPVSTTKNVCVKWEMKITAGESVFGPYEKSVDFTEEQRKHGQTSVATLNKILDCLLPMNPDTLLINLYFIAFDKDKTFTFDIQPFGLSLLSKDLLHLKNIEENYADVKLKVKDKYIQAHKAILCRNQKFSAYIEQSKNDVIEIPNFEYETIDAFVRFIYSGDIGPCINDPSISIVRCMQHFNCDALKPYYVPEDLPMTSRIKVETHEFHWHLPDIMEKDDFLITSPAIRRLGQNTIWKLTASLKLHDEDKYFSLFADIMDGDKPKYFCLEFALTNDSKKKFFPRRIIRHNQSYDNMGFEHFVQKRALFDHKSLILKGYLRFLLKIRTSDCSLENSLGCHAMAFVLPTDKNSYHQLSEDMTELLKKERYSDITIKCRNNTNINSHMCILTARSPGFRRKIENELPPNDKTLTMADFNPDILSHSVRYMYSGIFDDLMKADIAKLNDISSSENLDIPSLHEDSLKFLRDNEEYIS